MAKYKRYQGAFITCGGHIIRAEIWQENSGPFIVEDLDFSRMRDPITIDWNETGKLKPIQGSTVTVTLNSPSDRRYVDFADVVDYDAVRLDIYRDNTLYWRGHLDAENYCEPYTSLKNYDVSLSFSDFGILNRVPWSRHGTESLRTILQACLSAAGLGDLAVIHKVSTKVAEQGATVIEAASSLQLMNENFYDEEGEPMTCFEVLQGILQPFALRIIQRSGKVHIYDINALAAEQAVPVTFTDSDSELSYDIVYNNATLRFSPYGDDTVIDGCVDVKDTSGSGDTIESGYGNDTYDGFVVRHGSEVTATGPQLFGGAQYFSIKGLLSGGDASGILWGYYSGKKPLSSHPYLVGHVPTGTPGTKIASVTREINIGGGEYGNVGSKFMLRINLDLLLDVRYNPFEEATEDNERGNYKKMMDKCRFVYVPMMVKLTTRLGEVYHLENNIRGLIPESPRWEAGAGSPGCFWLSYYNDDRSESGLGGWVTNKRMVPACYPKNTPKSWSKMPQGEYVELPSGGGTLTVELYSGISIFSRTSQCDDIYDKFRWCAYKDLKVTLVQRNGTAVELKDQEDVAHINSSAYEDISLETIIGTLAEGTLAVTGRGLIVLTGHVLSSFYRAGETDRLEKLLLGTMYSNYAHRKTRLSGTVAIVQGMPVLEHGAMPGRKFMIVGETQDLVNDESKMIMTEISADDYRGIEYE